jgi:hypothetical protein
MDILRFFFSAEKGNRAPIFDWLPMGLLVIFALVLYWSDVSFTQPPNVRLIVDHATDLNATQLVLLVLMVPIVAIFLRPMQEFLIRLQEGYWPSSLAALSRWMCRWHMYRVKQLKQFIGREPETDAEREAIMEAAFKVQHYPLEHHIMPTRLGNVLRAGEDSAGERYGLSTVDVWPRLYQVLTQRLIDSATEGRNELDLALRFSGTFFLAGIASFVLMLQHGWWLLVPIVWLLSAWLSYQTAIRAAAAYGEVLKLAFDIHRFDLLRALHIPLPADARQELLLNRRLSKSWQYPQSMDFYYEHWDR